ncbi:hypothetical protein V8E36_006842 [Tilletia maclaganii]
MHFQQIFFFIALLAVAMSVQAKNPERAKECNKTADRDCPRGGHGHQIVFAACMAVYWKSIARTHKCRHPEVDCLCYNGCITDQSGSSPVTEFCVNACNLAQQPAPC